MFAEVPLVAHCNTTFDPTNAVVLDGSTVSCASTDISVTTQPHTHTHASTDPLAHLVEYNETSCARGDTICPARCTPDAAAQLQPIPYACGAQRALLPLAVGVMNINELMNINDVRESATIFRRPVS